MIGLFKDSKKKESYGRTDTSSYDWLTTNKCTSSNTGNRPSNNGMETAVTALTTPVGSISANVTDVHSPMSMEIPNAMPGG